jgi:4-hydroxy-4-methyl-2-oxoglutarate aldolase
MDERVLIAELEQISSATLHETMGKQHTMQSIVQPLWRPLTLCGPAFTVQARPADNLATHWGVAVAPAGSVLVISHEGDNSCGGWGEILSVAAQARGIKGMVTDGAVRDTEACRRLGFPIFSQGVSIKGTTKSYAGAVNVPVVCAGVTVHPGDYIVADDDGIVVAPRAQVEEIIARGRQRDQREAEIMQRLREGELTVDLLNLRGDLPGLAGV